MRRLTVAGLALALAGVAALGAHGAILDGLAYLLPPLLLLFALGLRRYPGERALLAAIARRSRRAPRVRRLAASSYAAARALVPRGGLLMAFALAVRPPPAGGSVSPTQ